MSYPTTCLPTQTVSDLANKDVDRLVGEITKFEAQSDPYMSVVGNGTMSDASDEVRFVSNERPLPGASLTRPVFVDDTAICGQGGLVTQVGTTEFKVKLQSLRERGPLVCMKQGRTAWSGVYQNIVDMLKLAMREIIASDIRVNLLDLGGIKLVANQSTGFTSALTGDINVVGTNFAVLDPNARITFKGIEYLGTYMREALGVTPFDGTMEEGTMLVLAGQDIVQAFRDEVNLREDVGSLTTGRYAMGEETITGYKFKGPYHGIGFGIDHRPLRFNSMITVANGAPDPRTGVVNTGSSYDVPSLIEPFVAVNTSKGVAARPNPVWVAAQHEILFLLGKDPFKRLVPESYAIPGFDFNPPISNQGLKFKVLNDADCNFFEDFGQHRYELSRGWQPQFPHAAAAVAFTRCPAVGAFTACPT